MNCVFRMLLWSLRASCCTDVLLLHRNNFWGNTSGMCLEPEISQGSNVRQDIDDVEFLANVTNAQHVRRRKYVSSDCSGEVPELNCSCCGVVWRGVLVWGVSCCGE